MNNWFMFYNIAYVLISVVSIGLTAATGELSGLVEFDSSVVQDISFASLITIPVEIIEAVFDVVKVWLGWDYPIFYGDWDYIQGAFALIFSPMWFIIAVYIFRSVRSIFTG